MTYTIYITYATAKLLHDFLGESAPEPMAQQYYSWSDDCKELQKDGSYCAYQLHDILSKPFCEAFNRRFVCENNVEKANTLLMSNISYTYYYGGLPAVEAELVEMMEAK